MKIEDFKPGDLIIILPNKSKCMNEGECKLVKQTTIPELLYIDCKWGKHFLDALVNDDTGEIEGIEKLDQEKFASVKKLATSITEEEQ